MAEGVKTAPIMSLLESGFLVVRLGHSALVLNNEHHLIPFHHPGGGPIPVDPSQDQLLPLPRRAELQLRAWWHLGDEVTPNVDGFLLQPGVHAVGGLDGDDVAALADLLSHFDVCW